MEKNSRAISTTVIGMKGAEGVSVTLDNPFYKGTIIEVSNNPSGGLRGWLTPAWGNERSDNLHFVTATKVHRGDTVVFRLVDSKKGLPFVKNLALITNVPPRIWQQASMITTGHPDWLKRGAELEELRKQKIELKKAAEEQANIKVLEEAKARREKGDQAVEQLFDSMGLNDNDDESEEEIKPVPQKSVEKEGFNNFLAEQLGYQSARVMATAMRKVSAKSAVKEK